MCTSRAAHRPAAHTRRTSSPTRRPPVAAPCALGLHAVFGAGDHDHAGDAAVDGGRRGHHALLPAGPAPHPLDAHRQGAGRDGEQRHHRIWRRTSAERPSALTRTAGPSMCFRAASLAASCVFDRNGRAGYAGPLTAVWRPVTDAPPGRRWRHLPNPHRESRCGGDGAARARTCARPAPHGKGVRSSVRRRAVHRRWSLTSHGLQVPTVTRRRLDLLGLAASMTGRTLPHREGPEAWQRLRYTPQSGVTGRVCGYQRDAVGSWGGGSR